MAICRVAGHVSVNRPRVLIFLAVTFCEPCSWAAGDGFSLQDIRAQYTKAKGKAYVEK